MTHRPEPFPDRPAPHDPPVTTREHVIGMAVALALPLAVMAAAVFVVIVLAGIVR